MHTGLKTELQDLAPSALLSEPTRFLAPLHRSPATSLLACQPVRVNSRPMSVCCVLGSNDGAPLSPLGLTLSLTLSPTARSGRGETFLLAGVDSRPCRHRSSQLLLELAFEFFTVVWVDVGGNADGHDHVAVGFQRELRGYGLRPREAPLPPAVLVGELWRPLHPLALGYAPLHDGADYSLLLLWLWPRLRWWRMSLSFSCCDLPTGEIAWEGAALQLLNYDFGLPLGLPSVAIFRFEGKSRLFLLCPLDGFLWRSFDWLLASSEVRTSSATETSSRSLTT